MVGLLDFQLNDVCKAHQLCGQCNSLCGAELFQCGAGIPKAQLKRKLRKHCKPTQGAIQGASQFEDELVLAELACNITVEEVQGASLSESLD